MLSLSLDIFSSTSFRKRSIKAASELLLTLEILTEIFETRLLSASFFFFSIIETTLATRYLIENGFSIYSSAPTMYPSSFASTVFLAVSITTGIPHNSIRLFIARHSSQPSILGIIMSVITSDTGIFSIISIALSPLEATTTLYSSENDFLRKSRSSGSSSTIRIVALKFSDKSNNDVSILDLLSVTDSIEKTIFCFNGKVSLKQVYSFESTISRVPLCISANDLQKARPIPVPCLTSAPAVL